MVKTYFGIGVHSSILKLQLTQNGTVASYDVGWYKFLYSKRIDRGSMQREYLVRKRTVQFSVAPAQKLNGIAEM